ncbi:MULTISPECIES: NTP transferase domain-containing protein [Sphingomonas]|jgi:1L-myo-inositol 1-phosphate cytidylyltransferase|uniref:phosphocholine cytidylyltransferase family protein n=1 Tax=Sphingomonas TaxID=13687 RepID=UPI00193C8104|nr:MULTISPECIES: NTP transferase domain-containing protein [Sphingomonas]
MLTTGLLLAAGAGSRLRGVAPYKPLCPVAGRPLIDHALEGMAAAGLTRAIVSLGYGADAIAAHLVARSWPLAVAVVMTDWHQPNGVSALAARDWIGPDGAVMAMCDHLVQPRHYRRLAKAGPGKGLTLGIDRRLGHPWVDPLDVTCVATKDDRIVAIGKGLAPHDCYDTGVFAIGPRFLDVLAGLDSPSLTDGVRALAGKGRARVVDCSDLAWIDVDDAPAFAHAEDWQGKLAA